MKIHPERMTDVGETTSFTTAEQPHPLLGASGVWDKDDPLVQDWKQIMEENRRKAEADSDF